MSDTVDDMVGAQSPDDLASGPTRAWYEKGTPSSAIDDRRNEDYGSVKWANVLPALRDLGVSLGNYVWGTPQIPEAPDSSLSNDLGKRNIKIEPNIGRSLLHRAIDDIQTGFNTLGVGRGESWADRLTDDNLFSKVSSATIPPSAGVTAQSPDDLAAMSPETYVNPAANAAFRSTLSLPRRAIESAATYRQTGQYDPAPIEAATLPMGTGAIAGVPLRAGEMALGSGMLRARYDKALAEGKITLAEHQGFVEALGTNAAPTAGLAEKFSGQQRHIADIIRETGLSKEQVQQWLVGEAKAGRVTMHPTTSVDLPKEVMNAGFHLPGFKEPFISAYFKPQPKLRPVDYDPFAGTQKLVPVEHDPFAGNQ